MSTRSRRGPPNCRSIAIDVEPPRRSRSLSGCTVAQCVGWEQLSSSSATSTVAGCLRKSIRSDTPSLPEAISRRGGKGWRRPCWLLWKTCNARKSGSCHEALVCTVPERVSPKVLLARYKSSKGDLFLSAEACRMWAQPPPFLAPRRRGVSEGLYQTGL